MKVPIIRLVDLGFDDGFGKAMSFAQSTLESINVSGQRAEVEYIRTSDLALVARSLTVPARLIHIMAHGIKEFAVPAFGAADNEGNVDFNRTLGLDALAEYLQENGEGIEATAVFADCCGSAQAAFTRALRDSLETEIVYIGATRSVDWHECTMFGSILYGSLLRKRGAGWDPAEWVQTAATMSISAYQEAVDGPCPFKVVTLTPSRSAKSAFANAVRGQGLG